MKNNTRISILILLFVGLLSCEKKNDENSCTGDWVTELTTESNAYASAYQYYLANPSAANCDTYKSAYQEYLNALLTYEDCDKLTGQNRADWQDLVSAAQAVLATLDCSQD